MTRIRCDATAAWHTLCDLYASQGRAFDLRQSFATDPDRFERLILQAPHVFADLSKNLISAQIQQELSSLARECGIEEHRDAMFGGELVNGTERRAVMHFLLRQPQDRIDERLRPAVQGALREVHDVLEAMLA